MSAVEIRDGEYRAMIILDTLPELPMPNIRKIFKLMKHAPGWDDAIENRLAEEQTADFLKAAVTDSEASWKQASSDYMHMWSLHTDRTTQANNRRLMADVRRTKNRHDRFVRIQTIFNET